MKKIFILLIIFGAVHQGWGTVSRTMFKSEPLHEEPYVVVYGRNSCGFTQNTIRELKKSGIPFEYLIVDEKPVADLLHSRMRESGIDTRRYNLPVVEVNNNFSIRPQPSAIIEAYDE